jgi:hypothetical protein
VASSDSTTTSEEKVPNDGDEQRILRLCRRIMTNALGL